MLFRILFPALFSCFAAVLHPAAARAENVAPGQTAAETLSEIFGEKGFDVLHRKGFVSRTRENDGTRITHVQWPLLKRTQADAPALRSFLAIYAKNRDGLSVEGSLEHLRLLQRRPVGGLLSPSVRAAVDALAALLRHAGELDKRLAAAPEDAGLFDAPWARDFVRPRRAALTLAPRKEAPAFFKEVLSRRETAAPSRAAVLAFVDAVYGEDLAPSLDADTASARLSPRTRKRLADYLADQRLLRTVFETQNRLRAIERSGTLARDAADIEAVLPGFEASGSIESVLREALRENAPQNDSRARPRISGPELRVHAKDGSTTLDVGDTAVVSAAFWIDGVPGGGEIEVSQLAFSDRGTSGIDDRTETRRRFKNGGPYSFSREVPVASHEPFVFRFHFDSPGAEKFSREIEIRPSPRYRDLLALAAEADREAASCMLDDAIDRYDALVEELKPLAKKRLFAELLRGVESRRRKARRQRELREDLQGAIDGAELFSSREQCDFRDDRALRALELLAQLPAGCDAMPEGPAGRSLARELRSQARAAQERAQAQKAFTRAVEQARERENRCRSERAVSLYAGALALLDADPGARCGAWERTYTLVRLEDLPRAAASSRLARAFSETADAAEKKFAHQDAAGALALLLPALAKIDAMPDARCFDSSRRRLEGLNEAYGIALSPQTPEKTAAAAKLPRDAVEKTAAAVAAEKTRREEKKRGARAAELRRQTPDAAIPHRSAP